VKHPSTTAAVLLSLALPAAASSQLEPGSVLVFPRTGFPDVGSFVGVSVTNTSLAPATHLDPGGTTHARFDYVSVDGATCTITERRVALTPADTTTRLVHCHLGSAPLGGYLVVSAEDPAQPGLDWAHDHLVGSQFVIEGYGVYALPALAFQAVGREHTPTDADGDGLLDFDGVEYAQLPDELYLDSFLASPAARLALINLSGSTASTAHVDMVVWNDHEVPLSVTTSFPCWMERRLVDLSALFDPLYLAQNTPDDPSETDVDCDGKGEVETGWIRIQGDLAVSPDGVVEDPALLGAFTGPAVDGGRPLWHSVEKQSGGEFLRVPDGGPVVVAPGL